jgi:FdhD protein
MSDTLAVMPPVLSCQSAVQHRGGQVATVALNLAEEVPTALVYNGISHAVLMTTPQHWRELAYGFSLTEGIIGQAHDIYAIELDPQQQGMNIQIELSSACFARLKQRRRQLTGRTGCGLCGVESLHMARPDLPAVDAVWHGDVTQIQQAFRRLPSLQPINQLTGGCHAAALLLADQSLQVFEDVGRHNALDKLIGWRMLQTAVPQGAVLLTSRLSFELVQKAAYAQLPLLAAISAPTALAVELAQQVGVQLVAFVRDDRMTWL